MLPVVQTRTRIALATSILAFIAVASAQQVDERMRAAADLEPAPWAEPEGASRPATIRDPALLRQSLQEIEFPVFDDVGDGAVWVLGRNYKARIDAGGLTFVPFLGSRAPRNFPVSLSLASATIGAQELPLHFQSQPVRDGQRIWVDHGSITEVFDVAADAIEQSFVVHRGAALGDLDVRLDVETDLRQTMNGLGTLFTIPGGGVHYGLATTLDANGSELVTTSLPVDRAVEFVVSADELARAWGDLTIDPILTTVNLEPSTYLDDRNPDVAYDVSNDRYIVAFERVYSANDHDVFCQMVSGATGQPIPSTWTYIDYTWEDWRTPAVANCNGLDQFLVVASVGSSARKIKGRTRAAASLTMGNQFAIPDGAVSGCAGVTYMNNVAPVVGGDSWPGGGSYCVAWVANGKGNQYMPNCPEVRFSMVTGNAVATVPQTLDKPFNAGGFLASEEDGTWLALSMSKSDGDSFSTGAQDWNLVWRQENWSMNNRDEIWGARIHWTGVVSKPATPLLVSGTTSLPGNPSSSWTLYSGSGVSTSQSTTTRRFMITFDVLGASGTPRLYGALVDPFSAWGIVPNTSVFDLTGLQGNASGNVYDNQWQPSVDCDGTNFLVAFNGYPDGITGMATAEFGDVLYYKKWTVYTVFSCLEPQTKVATSNFKMGRSHTCAESSGGGSRLNALIGCTSWGGYGSGGYYGGDPLVALHGH